MKCLLISLALVSGSVLACPADGSKDAMAPASSKPVVAAKAAPTATAVVAKPASKVATKSTSQPRKTASL